MTHILLVEDDDTLRQVTSHALYKRGFTVIELNNYQQAKEHIEKYANNKVGSITYDAAILDLKLNNCLSLPLIPLLRKNIPNINILILTGYASIATAVEAVKLGADDYLPKPASINDILAVLRLPIGLSEGLQPVDNFAITNNSNTAIVSTQRLEWEHIQRVLLKNNGNISAAARELNMHRRTLQRKLQKHPYKK